ncbi:MAG: serine/threonine-protein phosphatase [Ruminococcaceae bacterium]|nr:serine/threonine-protein phosphatase [Oscillospiraceae bacterium]
MKIAATACVNVGKRRSNNEDNLCFNGECLNEQSREAPYFRTVTLTDEQCFGACVCDGMGGESMGEAASLIGANAFAEWLGRIKTGRHFRWNAAAGEYFADGGEKVAQYSASIGAVSGCTAALLLLQEGRAYFANEGDSRVYLLRGKKIKRLTTDQTLAEMLVKTRRMKREQAEHSRAKSQLTGFLGLAQCKPNIGKPFRCRKGDRFLLCSDGLTDMLSEQQIYEKARIGEVSYCARDLMDGALAAGGDDNCTIILVEVS